MIRIAIFLLLSFVAFSLHAQEFGIGQWRDHFPYSTTLSVAQVGSRVYCATPYAVFYYDEEDLSIGRMNKVTTPGLSDVDITAMEQCDETEALVIAYGNANIDILDGTDIYNVSDIKRSTLVGNKTINNLLIKNKTAYLACGFGIVLLDIVDKEIKDTWIIGPEASYLNVCDITFNATDNHFYAATELGVFRADAASPNLADYNAWEKITFLPVINGKYNAIQAYEGKVFANLSTPEYSKDTLYILQGDQWEYFDLTITSDLKNLRVSREELIIAYSLKFKALDKNLTEIISIYSLGEGMTPTPMDGIADAHGNYWIADAQYGLIYSKDPWNHTFYVPNGPDAPFSFTITSSDRTVWVASGGYNQSWAPLNNKGLIYYFDEEQWNSLNLRNFPAFDTLRDISSIAIDPSDRQHIYIGSFGYGLHEMRNGEIIASYGAENSPLYPPTGYPGNRVRISGLSYDNSSNLWVSVSLGGDALTVRKPNGEWVELGLPTYANGTEVAGITIDLQGQKWIRMREANAVLVFNDNNTLDDTSDDRIIKLSSAANNGAIPGDLLLSLACDLDGEIWLGTNQGIGVIYNPENIFQGGSFDAQQILVEYDGHTRPLLETESVTAIAVDGANRKWIGTDKAGVFLLSADGITELAHYTEDNSPLISNTITAITINDRGEVFFGTANGIVSFLGTATPGKPVYKDVYAYPNPVRPGYEGTIAITGLIQNAYVKITDVSGNLVYSTRAEGGQAVWDGKTMHGDKVDTGVYLVFISDNTAEQTMVTKIMVFK
ncbi:MAG: T9SS type A sorting domain-containing protein [Bacteroidales bacterium]|nr:T9SS type A sorting domain-containing protein [Bacteroidales bacterium]HPE87695.1 T9SS type A sorting domain-containing protein [Bacteroidales bacterium]